MEMFCKATMWCSDGAFQDCCEEWHCRATNE